MSTDIQTKSIVETKLQPPKLWKVVFLNDDQTPMELVIDILMKIFKHSEQSAKEITLDIHNSGSGIAGVYKFEIAEIKTIEATNIARSVGSPLKIHVEEEH